MERYRLCYFILVISNNECLTDLYLKLKDESESSSKWLTKIDFYSTATIPVIKIIANLYDYEINADITYLDENHYGGDWVKLIKDYISEFLILSDIVRIL